MSALHTAHRIAGGLGIAAGALAVLGSQLPLLELRAASRIGRLLHEAPAAVPDVPAGRWAALAGVFLALASAGLFSASRAGRVRPAVSVLWAAPLPAVFATLRTVSTAVDASLVPDPFVRLAAPVLGPGPGVWLMLCAAGSACATGLACLVAGVLDREAWEAQMELAANARSAKPARKARQARPVAQEEQPDRGLVVALAVAGGCGVTGLLSPLYYGHGFWSTWLPDVPFEPGAFGQFFLAAVIGTAAVIGAMARPEQRPAVLIGSALALVLYASGYPVASSRLIGSTPGPGFWLSLAGAVVFVVPVGQTLWRGRGQLGSTRRNRTKTRR